MRRLFIAVACLWAGCPHSAGAAPSPRAPGDTPPAWVGEMTSANGRRFALAGAGAGGAPQWLGLGENWEGYVVVHYEPRPETLTLRHGADLFVLTLANGVVTAAPPAEAAAPAQADAIAAAEVRRRDGWGADAACEPPQRHDHQWWILVKRANGGRSEARMVILSDDGRVVDYWRV